MWQGKHEFLIFLSHVNAQSEDLTLSRPHFEGLNCNTWKTLKVNAKYRLRHCRSFTTKSLRALWERFNSTENFFLHRKTLFCDKRFKCLTWNMKQFAKEEKNDTVTVKPFWRYKVS